MSAAERTLTQRALNRALLARQLHARRTGILPSSTGSGSSTSRRRTRSTPSSSTARWPARGATRRDRIKLEPFGRLDRAARRELDEEAERLAELHA